MEAWLQSLILGIVQGLTEFLPVSSSGHLVLTQAWFGDDFKFKDTAVLVDLILHVGTLIPVLFFYRADLFKMMGAFSEQTNVRQELGWFLWLRGSPHRWLAAMVVLGTVPTGLIGIFFKDYLEDYFQNVAAVSIALLCTAALLVATRGAVAKPGRHITAAIALIIGLAQGIAITPGISRSGTTIAILLLLGVPRAEAARFSFLLSIPAILGAMVLIAKDGVAFSEGQWLALLVGFVTAMFVGYLALRLLVALVKIGSLHKFAFYLAPLGIAGLISVFR